MRASKRIGTDSAIRQDVSFKKNTPQHNTDKKEKTSNWRKSLKKIKPTSPLNKKPKVNPYEHTSMFVFTKLK